MLTAKNYTRYALLTAVAEQLQNAELYFGHGVTDAMDEAAWLLAHVLQYSPQEPLPQPDTPVSMAELDTVRHIVQQRMQTRKPLAYLLNSAWFANLEFYLDERVLVPRSPLAELIQHAFAPWLTTEPKAILDLCTGSGCIAIACAAQFPHAQVDASDVSAAALQVAAINLQKHELTDRVQLHQVDVFDGLSRQGYDIIISNPPYVTVAEMTDLPAEYRTEPELALAAGADGLTIVRRILQSAANYLAPDGLLICEVGAAESALLHAYPKLPFIWLEFERGGAGVFLLYARDLDAL